MVLEIAENTHFFVKIKKSRISATVPGQTTVGPALQVHIIQYLGINGMEILILSTTTKERTSWVVICRGNNRYVEELHLNDPDHNPTSYELLFGEICCIEKRTWFDKDGAITEYRGNSCEAV